MNLTIRVFDTDFSTESPLVVDAAGIVINADTNGGAADNLVAVVPDGESAVVTVDQAGYHSYSMTIDNVYSTDLILDVVLVPVITDVNDPNYLRPYPKFFSIYDRCSYCVDHYFASSFGAEVSWYVNNELYKEGTTKINTCFCNTGDFQVKVRTTSTQWVVEVPGCPAVPVLLWDRQYATIQTGNTVSGDIDSLDTYLDLDTTTNITILEYRPDLFLEVETDTEPFAETVVCCYPKGTEITIVPTYALNRIGADPALHNLTYTLIDPEGIETELVNTTLDQADLTAAFTLELLGTYTVTATITDTECNNTFTSTLAVETCNFIVNEYVECNTFDIINKSSATDVTFTVNSIDGTNILTDEALAAGQAYRISFTDVNLYLVDVTYGENVERYVLNNYCIIEDCLATYILDILCEDTRRCAPCPDEVELNQMLLLWNTYFMKLNSEYGWNNFYSGMEQTKLDELTNLKQLMDKIVEFCKRRGCLDEAFKNPYLTEGPYDWAGQGSNCDKSCNCNPPTGGAYYNTTKPGYCTTCGGTT